MEKDFMDFDEKERNYNVDHIVVLKVLPSLKKLEQLTQNSSSSFFVFPNIRKFRGHQTLSLFIIIITFTCNIYYHISALTHF